MAQDEHQRGRAIVGHGGRFRAAEQGEVVLEISRARAAFAAGEVEFEIVVIRRDGAECLNHRFAERRATQVGVHDDTGAVDDRLNAARAKSAERRADAGQHAVEGGNFLAGAESGQFPADDRDDRRTRQVAGAE